MRALVRLVFTLILLAIALAVGYYIGYRAATGRTPSLVRSVVGTSGSKTAAEAETTLERKLSEAGSQASAFLSDAALTAKIKSKMSLDDHIDAGNIHVSTSGGIVTLTGRAQSPEEHARAVALAGDTKGVKTVVDRIAVR